jgi:hypothetical protein
MGKNIKTMKSFCFLRKSSTTPTLEIVKVNSKKKKKLRGSKTSRTRSHVRIQMDYVIYVKRKLSTK